MAAFLPEIRGLRSLMIPSKQWNTGLSDGSSVTMSVARSDAGSLAEPESGSGSGSTVYDTLPGQLAARRGSLEVDNLLVAKVQTARAVEKDTTPYTMSADWFTKQEFFDVELPAVFASGWTYAGHLSLLYPSGKVTGTVPDGTYRQLLLGPAGDYFICRVDNEWKGFRGLAPGRTQGISKETEILMDCGATIRSNETGVLTTEQLVEARTCQKVFLHITVPSDLVFVSFLPGPSFAEYFGDFEDTLREYDFDSCGLHATWRTVGAFNWKVWVDGYQECVGIFSFVGLLACS